MKTKQTTSAQPNPLGSPAVIGLEAGRHRARQSQRRRRLRDRVVTTFWSLAALASVSAAAWAGYNFYHENQASERLEIERRQAEMEGPGSIEDIITDLEDEPRWNGPGNPTFGVGDAPVATTP